MATNLTRFTVQEVLNRKLNFEEYHAAVSDNGEVDWSDWTQLSTEAAPKWLASKGRTTSPFADTSKIWSEVSFYELGDNQSISLKLNIESNPIIFLGSASLPITFTGHDISDVWIKTNSTNVAIQVWR